MAVVSPIRQTSMRRLFHSEVRGHGHLPAFRPFPMSKTLSDLVAPRLRSPVRSSSAGGKQHDERQDRQRDHSHAERHHTHGDERHDHQQGRRHATPHDGAGHVTRPAWAAPDSLATALLAIQCLISLRPIARGAVRGHDPGS